MTATLTAEPLAAAEAPADEEEVFVFPATAAQRRFWLLDQLVPGGNPALNTPVVLRLRGTLDRPALERAFAALAERHEALRTTFQYEKDELCQIIAPSLDPRVASVDVRDFPEAERPGVPTHLAAEEAARPFDLARGPLWRVLLVCLHPSEHTLLLTLHHIICDGWSNGVLLRELGALYGAFSHGKPSPLAELPLQFADFAQWQQDQVAAGGFDADLAYWREKLAGQSPTLDLPADHARGASSALRVAPARTCRGQLPAALAASLKALAVREEASAYMLHLAVFAVLLSRYDASGGEDVLVSTPSANRTRAEVEGVVGLFANPLLLRTDLAGDPTFRELLGRVRQTVLDAFRHAEAPFERVIETLQSRGLQFNFAYDGALLRPVKLPELEILPQDPASGGATYEWDATVAEDAAGIRVSIEYNADLFDAATVERALADYEALLTGIAAPGGTETKIRQLPLADGSLEWLGRRGENRPATPALSPGLEAGQGEPYLTIHHQLIDLWQELLNVPHVGIHDDFFALGGNSLLAIRMLHRVEGLCGRKLQPATLFRRANIEGLADAILQRGGDGPAPELISIQENGTKTPIFFLHGDMTGGGYYCMKLSRRLGPDQPFYALPPADVSDWRALPSIESLAAGHLRAIRRVRPRGPYIIGGFCLGGLTAHAVACQLAAEGETVERLIIVDATARNRRVKRLRRRAERLGSRRGWDPARQLYHFCRWHFLLERLDRWRKLGVGGQFAIVRRRAAGVARKMFGRILPAAASETIPAAATASEADLAPRDRGGSELDGSWFDPRWDVPLVFLWAEGGYEVKNFAGRATLLLSRDLAGPDAEEPVAREWARHLPHLEVGDLAGRHLECITEHADGLAETIRETLAR